jgi:hypothetical protein
MAQPLISGAVVFAVLQGHGMSTQNGVPQSIYIAHAGMMGASKILVDMAVPGDNIQRALAAGALYCGLTYLFYKDENYALNGALGIGASYVADVIMPKPAPKEEDEYPYP